VHRADTELPFGAPEYSPIGDVGDFHIPEQDRYGPPLAAREQVADNARERSHADSPGYQDQPFVTVVREDEATRQMPGKKRVPSRPMPSRRFLNVLHSGPKRTPTRINLSPGTD
jgi:hypothetical protein